MGSSTYQPRVPCHWAKPAHILCVCRLLRNHAGFFGFFLFFFSFLFFFFFLKRKPASQAESRTWVLPLATLCLCVCVACCEITRFCTQSSKSHGWPVTSEAQRRGLPRASHLNIVSCPNTELSLSGLTGQKPTINNNNNNNNNINNNTEL